MAGRTTFSILVKPPGFFFQGGEHSSSEEDLFIGSGTYSEDENYEWLDEPDQFFGSAQPDTEADFDTFFTDELNYF